MTHRILGIIATETQVKNNEPSEFITKHLSFIDWHQSVKESKRWNLSEFPDQPIKSNDNKIKEVFKSLNDDFIKKHDRWIEVIKEELNKKDVNRVALCAYLDHAGTRSSNIIDMRENCIEYIIDLDFDKSPNAFTDTVKNNDFLCLFDVHE